MQGSAGTRHVALYKPHATKAGSVHTSTHAIAAER
jgi:hypothetical protein